jgi:plastocyanin
MRHTLFILAALALIGATQSVSDAQNHIHTVHIRDFAFVPATLSIARGDTVIFINDDDDAHTVTASDKSFDSAGLDTHDRWKHTFTKDGTYTYFCALHPYMKGTIVVNEPAGRTS